MDVQLGIHIDVVVCAIQKYPLFFLHYIFSFCMFSVGKWMSLVLCNLDVTCFPHIVCQKKNLDLELHIRQM